MFLPVETAVENGNDSATEDGAGGDGRKQEAKTAETENTFHQSAAAGAWSKLCPQQISRYVYKRRNRSVD